MPNKYNIKAKRQVLDNLIRERAWKSFQTNFNELLSQGDDNYTEAKSVIFKESSNYTSNIITLSM